MYIFAKKLKSQILVIYLLSYNALLSLVVLKTIHVHFVKRRTIMYIQGVPKKTLLKEMCDFLTLKILSLPLALSKPWRNNIRNCQ